MKRTLLVMEILLVSNPILLAADPAPVSHREFQAVDDQGNSTFIESGIQTVQIEGILLNSPEQWLDPTADATHGRPLFHGRRVGNLYSGRRGRSRGHRLRNSNHVGSFEGTL